MNNLPPGTTQDMIEAQCAPIAKNMEFCEDCDESHPSHAMYRWSKNYWDGRGFRDVYLCADCVPRCLWNQDDAGHVHLDLHSCGRIQSPNAQGPWCAEHEKEAEALDNQESEK